MWVLVGSVLRCSATFGSSQTWPLHLRKNDFGWNGCHCYLVTGPESSLPKRYSLEQYAALHISAKLWP